MNGGYEGAGLLELLTRLLCDVEPNNVLADGVFLFGQTADNESSVLTRAASLWPGKAANLVIRDEAGSGYPGAAVWAPKLVSLGVPKNAIVVVSMGSRRSLNTYTEAEVFIEMAKARGWKTVYVTAAPFHQLRAFVTAVSILKKSNISLAVFSAPGKPLSWREKVVHSQGIWQGDRAEFISGEVERVIKYFWKGDLLACGQVIQYLDSRDSMVESQISKIQDP